MREAVMYLRAYQPEEGYVLAFSGGKDSVVCWWLCVLSGVRFEMVYSNTTIDPPQVLRFVRKWWPECRIVRPRRSFWQCLRERGFLPTSRARWCCSALKHGLDVYRGRLVIVGNRDEESARRRRREARIRDIDGHHRIFEVIKHWSERDVWECIRYFGLPVCELYDMGFTRIGCVVCPMMRKYEETLSRKYFPGYWRLLERVCEESVLPRRREYYAKYGIHSGRDLVNWWRSRMSIRKWAMRHGTPTLL